MKIVNLPHVLHVGFRLPLMLEIHFVLFSNYKQQSALTIQVDICTFKAFSGTGDKTGIKVIFRN